MKETKIFNFGVNVEPACAEQIEANLKNPSVIGEHVAIMPDAHAGKGINVGWTQTFTDKIVPNFVGVDIGCGMAYIKLPKEFTGTYDELKKLQSVIRQYVPSGNNVHTSPLEHELVENVMDSLTQLNTKLTERDIRHISNSLGTLGSGNHCIELDRSDITGDTYLVIHTGSRNLGVKVCEYFMDKAKANFKQTKPSKEEILAVAPEQRSEFIKSYSNDISAISEGVLPGSEYLHEEWGDDFWEYLEDMKLAQEYAWANRTLIVLSIFGGMGYSIENYFTDIKHTVHNYVDIDAKIIRKGAIDASLGKEVVIPINMRDGVILATGKGNPDANFSGPHGAGRVMSRTTAKATITMDDYKKSMEGITSWTINENTIDEAPQAYKALNDILEGVKDLVEVKEVLKPIFNFKADDAGPRR